MTLTELYESHKGKVSFKWQLYLSEYESILKEYSNSEINLLEIGIQNGGSLEILAKFFPRARNLIGCDINPKCSQLSFDDKRIEVIVGDANLNTTRESIANKVDYFDIVIDDGSHNSSDIISSFVNYFPHIRNNGLFIIEDLHASYWSSYEGSLYHPTTSINFLKTLVDVINHEHWGVDKSRESFLNEILSQLGLHISEDELAKIHSITFVNSLCFIKKSDRKLNTLGSRQIAGTTEAVASGHLELKDYIGPAVPPLTQTLNQWSVIEKSPAAQFIELVDYLKQHNFSFALPKEAFENLERELALKSQEFGVQQSILQNRVDAQEQIVIAQKRSLDEYQSLVNDRDEFIKKILNSGSWKITSPLRIAMRLLKKLFNRF